MIGFGEHLDMKGTLLLDVNSTHQTFLKEKHIVWGEDPCIIFGLPHTPATVTNEGLGWDSLLKNTKHGIFLVVTVTGWGGQPK